MKLRSIAAAALALAASVALAQSEQLNQAIGVLLGANIQASLLHLQDEGIAYDRDQVLEALDAYLRGDSIAMTPQQAQATLRDAFDAHDRELAAAEVAFIDSVAALPDAARTPSGLVFIVLTPGQGEFPTAADTVELTYTARLSSGEMFDESTEPVQFPVEGLVPGFSEGLCLMQPGGSYRLVIPAELGYGAQGIPGIIPGGAALDFTVNLIRIVK
ncbi:MAG: FKBP-type peptidyl-prolyl cis-trans isomerase [Muribaculaceae bacterium]